jgi:putative membrane protein
MKPSVRIAMLAGLALAVVLVARDGTAAVLEPLGQAGWLVLLLVPLHLLPLLLDVLGWRLLIRGHARLPALLGIAAVREAVNRLLPVANIGGEIVGIRLLAHHGAGAVDAAASVIVEVLLTVFSQAGFVLLGLACLLGLTGALGAGLDLGSDLAIATLGALGLAAMLSALLRHASLFALLERAAARLLGGRERLPDILADSARLDAAIRALCARHGRLLAAMGWQLLGLVTGTLETWLALRWLGHPVGMGAAIALESLTQAARHFLFLVPAGIGVQEAGLVGVGYLLGIGSELALSLSLVKRLREIVFGLPALIVWYWMEERRGLDHVRSRSQC